MNLVLICEEDFLVPAKRIRLHGRRMRHVLEVHRAGIGDELRVGLINGRIGTGHVAAISAETIEIDVVLDRPPPPAVMVTLLVALPRPKTLKKVLQTAAAMGIKRILLINSWRVEKSFWGSPLLSPDGLREQLLLGLEQGGDTVLPEVALRPRFKPFVEDELPELIRGSQALVAHPTATEPCPRAIQTPLTLAVGPEGGFIPYEIERLESLGFTAVSLGERRLRVEQAIPALLGRLL